MIRTLSQMYVQPLGDALADCGWTRVGFLIGAWAVLFKTLYVATAANSRLTADFLDLTGHLAAARSRRPASGRSGSSASSTRSWRSASTSSFREPQGLVTVGGIAQGLMLPLIAGATLYLRSATPTAASPPSFLTDILTWLAFFAISAVAMYSVYDPGPRSLD